MQPVCAWISYEAKHLEHHWARFIAGMQGASPIKGFGSSDCKCLTHLFYTTKMPDYDAFKRAAGSSVQSCSLDPLK
jgi:Uri superfamily endonuclease